MILNSCGLHTFLMSWISKNINENKPFGRPCVCCLLRAGFHTGLCFAARCTLFQGGGSANENMSCTRFVGHLRVGLDNQECLAIYCESIPGWFRFFLSLPISVWFRCRGRSIGCTFIASDIFLLKAGKWSKT